jgi:hypothetical protein
VRMDSPSCPTCHALRHMLIEAEPDVVRRGVEARAQGPGFGVLVGLPEELGAETEEEAAELEAAREVGYYVGVMPVEKLARMVPGKGHDLDAIAGILRQLHRPPPPGQIHVVALLDGCVAAVTARADPEIAAARDLEAMRLRRVGQLLALAEPSVLARAGEQARRPGSVFFVAEPGDPAATRLRRGPDTAVGAGEDRAYVELVPAADAVAALPLEGLETDDALRAMRRLTSPIPEGNVRVVAVFDGHITMVTSRAAPGCLALR